MTDKLEASSLAECVAYVLEISPHDIPRDGDVALGQWLARRNLGLVPVKSVETFAWPGHFLGRRRDSRTWAVLFGVPPGVVFEPEPPTTPEAFDDAFVMAAHDPKREGDPNKRVEPSRAGTIELIAISAEAEGLMTTVRSAKALAYRGLRGDRYECGAGSFSNPSGRGYDLTLVEAEALEELAAGGVKVAPFEARRNLVVRGVSLDDLIGKRFHVGEVECFGQRRCEPCAHLERLTRPGVLRGLVHRGGLRADVLSDGEIRVGDRAEALL